MISSFLNEKAKKLTEKDLDNLDLKKNDKDLYVQALKAGASLYLINETEDGYDVSILFEPNQK